MNNEYLSVVSEIYELEKILVNIPEEDVIDRMSLESRLKTVREILAMTPKTDDIPKVRLTFRGKPILGSRGMFADFAAKAVCAFSDAFSMVAVGLSGNMRDAGLIPSRDRNQLLITGTTIGSFGFEFELSTQSPVLFHDQGKAEDAMKKIETLLRYTAEGSDDDIAEVVDEIHPRAAKKMHEFLDFLVKQEAWCGLDVGDRKFRFVNYEQIKASSDRLRDALTFIGPFNGNRKKRVRTR